MGDIVVRRLPSQMGILCDMLGEASKHVSHVSYVADHRIRVCYRNSVHFIEFPVTDWLSDACVARIALEIP